MIGVGRPPPDPGRRARGHRRRGRAAGLRVGALRLLGRRAGLLQRLHVGRRRGRALATAADLRRNVLLAVLPRKRTLHRRADVVARGSNTSGRRSGCASARRGSTRSDTCSRSCRPCTSRCRSGRDKERTRLRTTARATATAKPSGRGEQGEASHPTPCSRPIAKIHLWSGKACVKPQPARSRRRGTNRPPARRRAGGRGRSSTASVPRLRDGVITKPRPYCTL